LGPYALDLDLKGPMPEAGPSSPGKRCSPWRSAPDECAGRMTPSRKAAVLLIPCGCRGWRKGLLPSTERFLVNDMLHLYRLPVPLRHKVKGLRARSWALPTPAPLWGQSGGKAF